MRVTNNCQSFYWKGYGLKLYIPSQSLPSHANSCTISIAVSLSGQYKFPAGTQRVSPVFWLKCEPKTKFIVPLSLEIEHCALLENTANLFMARALCSQEDLPYSFQVLDGGIFTEHSTYGVIQLSQFSCVGVGQKQSKDQPLSTLWRYWSKVYYMAMDQPNDKKIHFVVTWDDDAHQSVSYA